MALISRAECGCEISDKAVSCPHCGNPGVDGPAPPREKKESAYLDKNGRPRQPYRWELERDELVEKKKQSSPLTILLIVAILIIGLVANFSSGTGSPAAKNKITSEHSTRKAELERQKRLQADAQEREERRKGFHCLSSWDGSLSALKTDIKNRLRDPKSFDHVETKITPVNSYGEHVLVMTYRAKNGFGGVNVEQASALVKNSDCSYTIISAD